MIWLNPMDRLKVEIKEDRYTVAELRAMCKTKGLKGYSKLKEIELIALLGL